MFPLIIADVCAKCFSDTSNLVATFCSITNSTPEKAQEYLGVADGDLSTAVTLFFESGGVTGDYGSESSNAVQPEQTEEVRAPIAPTREVLVDPMADTTPGLGFVGNEFGFGSGLPRMNRRQRRRVGIFDQSPSEVPVASSADTSSEESESNSRASRLAKLFRPPYDIISHLTLDEAKMKATYEKRWILINLQTSSSFECQVLNRDLWKSESVKEVIRAHFLFLQLLDDEEMGMEFKRFYPVLSTPHIAILDPRTGERVKQWNGGITPTEFVIELNDFLERCTLDETKDRKNPLGPKSQKPAEAMTEEEQMSKAIAASLGVEQERTESTGESSQPIQEDEEEEQDNTVHKIKSEEGKDEEPSPGPGVTRIQIRMPTGARFIRRFYESDLVRKVYAYVKGVAEGADSQAFSLTFQRTSLWNSLDKTIKEAGIQNTALQFEFQ
ncbi:UB Xdomain protein Ubx2 [Schizosaccharomyces cryophilus OY26]|uniref:UB Xdomain protein Ubx2 n=1 Tax=Schizosaccharomyces cryophilus (strain OY26 / ATCC MYA-4695 / CBS 11777 / NBRC 106824 / NRRL Y48691) TaxID=653667 RepID=S9X4H5_SCHCR|nr:UB Xdomain protein Ubx2 [Schizosaccharomyces cryophilus OY26]EPY51977.1 UB Xdomain protein Ubx2 [Schizosaccharomyces cryophilus OY26]